jgi:hypothetical protein
MTKIVDLQNYRTHALEQRAFGAWRRRFGEDCGLATRFEDLSDRTLYSLALPGDDSAVPFYEVVMGVLDLGAAAGFFFLDDEDKIRVVDRHLFLADHVRFEMMRRLGWVSSYACAPLTLVEMIQDFRAAKRACMAGAPKLAETHPGYAAYRQLTIREKQVFVRRLLRDALEAFEKKIKTS